MNKIELHQKQTMKSKSQQQLRTCNISFAALIIFNLLLPTEALEHVVRKTVTGKLRGFLHEVDGTVGEVFLSVPYAKPPIGKLRLEYPEPPDPWDDIRNATEFPPWCIQFWFPDFRLEARIQAEDCLYINVYIPHKIETSLRPPYPALVWAHGGSYQVNGANMFPTDGIVKNLVSRGIACIFVNYRLGPLGFLSTLSDTMPGNYGLEDQMMALRWVQENGAAFDIDTNRVALGGESAGAGSASLLAMSPRAVGLFNRVILRSGSALTPWAARTMNTNLNSESFIRSLRCGKKMSDGANVKKCMQKTNVGQWIEEWRALGEKDIKFVQSRTKEPVLNYNHPFLAHTYFTPVMDNVRGNRSIIPEYPSEMIKKNTRMPMLVGVTSGECIAYVMWLYFVSRLPDWAIDLTNLEYVVPRVIYKNKEQIKEAVFKQYVHDRSFREDTNYARTLVEIVSDQNFITAAVEEARIYAENDQPVYAYQFHHTNVFLRKKHQEYDLYNVGSAHGYDMVFLFQNTSVLDPNGEVLNWTEEDLRITDTLADSMASFVRTGQAKINDLAWPKFTPSECGEAMQLQVKPELGPFFPERYDFWKKVIPVVDSLSLSVGYQYYHPMVCIDGCHQFIYYRAAFFVACVLVLLLFFALILSFCTRSTKANSDSYQLPTLNLDN